MPVFHTFTAGGKRYMFDANTNVIINLKRICILNLRNICKVDIKRSHQL